jgi:hypothetical protein
MKDKNKILAGLAIFIVVVTFPFWFNLGKAAPAPELELTAKAKAAKTCVMPTEFMTANHMQLLDVWRHNVVRGGERMFVSADNKLYDMSLSNTCLDCHSNKEKFCDRCHDYASVRPYCWDCHIDNPKGE